MWASRGRPGCGRSEVAGSFTGLVLRGSMIPTGSGDFGQHLGPGGNEVIVGRCISRRADGGNGFCPIWKQVKPAVLELLPSISEFFDPRPRQALDHNGRAMPYQSFPTPVQNQVLESLHVDLDQIDGREPLSNG